jgi:uncharacterized protein YfiM (DUF2279 family)
LQRAAFSGGSAKGAKENEGDHQSKPAGHFSSQLSKSSASLAIGGRARKRRAGARAHGSKKSALSAASSMRRGKTRGQLDEGTERGQFDFRLSIGENARYFRARYIFASCSSGRSAPGPAIFESCA